MSSQQSAGLLNGQSSRYRLSALPLELLHVVTEYLETEDTLALRLTCSEFSLKVHQAHLDKIFNTRKYYWTIIDLEALITFSKRIPYKAKLKHLIIEIAPPYLIPSTSIHLPPPPFTPEVFARNFRSILELGSKHYYQVELVGMKHLHLIISAIGRLPDLTHIDILGADHHTTVPDKVVLAHYEKYISQIFTTEFATPPQIGNLQKLFLGFYKSYHASVESPDGVPTRWYAYAKLPQVVFNFVLYALWKYPRNLQQFRFLKKDRKFGYIPLNWFYERCMILGRCPPLALKDLRVLALHVKHQPEIDMQDLKASITTMRNYQISLATFIVYPKRLQDLTLSSSNIPWAHRMRNPVSGKHHPYFQAIQLYRLEIGCQTLRKIHFDTLSFSEVELLRFLLSLRNTLRSVSLINCQLQAPRQLWFRIFKHLQSLRLEYFEYEATHCRMRHWILEENKRYSPEAISWFRAYGDIGTPHHYCELLPKKYNTLSIQTGSPDRRVNYDHAIEIVRLLEKFCIQKASPEQNNLFEEKFHTFCSMRLPISMMMAVLLWSLGPYSYYHWVPVPLSTVEIAIDIMKKLGAEKKVLYIMP